MLSLDRAVLMIVDVQSKLVPWMCEKERLLQNLQILVQAAQVLKLPVLWLEQNPAGLGPTIPEIGRLLSEQQPFCKMSFSACGNADVMRTLQGSGRTQVLLAGIEAHVCIYLTAADLLAQGYEVEVVADAVASRAAANEQIGLNKIAAAGGGITCTETALFELLVRAEGQRFKEIIKLVR